MGPGASVRQVTLAQRGSGGGWGVHNGQVRLTTFSEALCHSRRAETRSCEVVASQTHAFSRTPRWVIVLGYLEGLSYPAEVGVGTRLAKKLKAVSNQGIFERACRSVVCGGPIRPYTGAVGSCQALAPLEVACRHQIHILNATGSQARRI